jgi:hypothetical protein
MRHRRDRRVIAADADRRTASKEELWRTKVGAVFEASIAYLPDVKKGLVALIGYLPLAPNEECQHWIQERIAIMRHRLADLEDEWRNQQRRLNC